MVISLVSPLNIGASLPVLMPEAATLPMASVGASSYEMAPSSPLQDLKRGAWKKSEASRLLDAKALLLLNLSPEERALLRAGVVPAHSPASDVVDQLSPFLRRTTASLVHRWRPRGVFFEFEETLPRVQAAAVHFLIHRKWDPQKGGALGFLIRFFKKELEWDISKDHPLMRAVLRAHKTAAARTRRGVVLQKEAAPPQNFCPRYQDGWEVFSGHSRWDSFAERLSETGHSYQDFRLIVAHAIHDLFQDASITQRDKEVWLLLFFNRPTPVSDYYEFTRSRAYFIWNKGDAILRENLAKYLEAEGLGESWPMLEERWRSFFGVVRGMISSVNMGKIMATAGFDWSRWRALLAHENLKVPALPQTGEATRSTTQDSAF